LKLDRLYSIVNGTADFDPNRSFAQACGLWAFVA